MSKPLQVPGPETTTENPQMFFVTTGTAGGRSLFQTDRMAGLLIEVLREYVRAKKMTIHDFVVMPDHLHILMTLPAGMTIEKAMQFIKGGFSFRAGKELGFRGEIWQRGYFEAAVDNVQSEDWHRSYIDQNPVKARLVDSADQYRFGSAFLKKQKQAAAEAQRP